MTAEPTSQMADPPSFRSQAKPTTTAPMTKNLKSPAAKKVQKSSGYGPRPTTANKETKENKNIKNLQSYQAARSQQKKETQEPVKFESLKSFSTKEETATVEVTESKRYAAPSDTTSMQPSLVELAEEEVPVPEVTFTATD